MPGWWYKEAHRILSIRRTERALIIKAANRRNEMQTWLHEIERERQYIRCRRDSSGNTPCNFLFRAWDKCTRRYDDVPSHDDVFARCPTVATPFGHQRMMTIWPSITRKWKRGLLDELYTQPRERVSSDWMSLYVRNGY